MTNSTEIEAGGGCYTLLFKMYEFLYLVKFVIERWQHTLVQIDMLIKAHHNVPKYNFYKTDVVRFM